LIRMKSEAECEGTVNSKYLSRISGR